MPWRKVGGEDGEPPAVLFLVESHSFIQSYAKLNLLLYIPCKESAFLRAFLLLLVFCIGSGADFKASNIQGKFTAFTDYCGFQ